MVFICALRSHRWEHQGNENPQVPVHKHLHDESMNVSLVSFAMDPVGIRFNIALVSSPLVYDFIFFLLYVEKKKEKKVLDLVAVIFDNGGGKWPVNLCYLQKENDHV